MGEKILTTYRHPFTCLFLVAAMFPWVSFGMNDQDMQPWAMLIGVIYIVFIGKMKISPNYLLSFFVMIFGLVISILTSNEFGFLTLRAVYNFTSFFIFYSLFLFIFSKFDSLNFIKSLNYVWILGALVELFNPEFMEIFGKVRTSTGRGVTSFAPEPSFFSAHLIITTILIAILSNFNSKKNLFLIITNIVAIIFLARSAIGLSYLIVVIGSVLGFHLIRTKPTKIGFKFLLLIFLLFLIFGSFTISNTNDTRILGLIAELATEGPIMLFKLDASMNERLAHIVFPLYSFFYDYFIPHGIDAFSEERLLLEPKFGDFFWYSMNTDKIMSWYGDWLFTLGIFGVVSLALIMLPIIRGDKKNMWTFIAVSIVLFSAIPLAHPLIPALFASLYIRKKSI